VVLLLVNLQKINKEDPINKTNQQKIQHKGKGKVNLTHIVVQEFARPAEVLPHADPAVGAHLRDLVTQKFIQIHDRGSRRGKRCNLNEN
jgi:hypothetical protein